MNFLLKNGLNKSQLDVKNSLFPNHAYEIHLSNEIESCKDLQQKQNDTELAQKILKIFSDTPIKVIHTPLYKNHVNFIEEKETKEIFEYIVKTAEVVREKQHLFNHIIVVVHNKLSIQDMQKYGILDNTVKTLKTTAKKYPYIDIAIENTVWNYDTNEMDYYKNVELAAYCNELNIGVCIDTCHILMSQYFDKIVRENYRDLQNNCTPTIEKWLTESNKQVPIKLIHFSNAKNTGNGFGKDLGHGCGFDKRKNEDKIILTEILNTYQKINLTCPLTLELIEKDYMHPKNLPMTMECLTEMYKLN